MRRIITAAVIAVMAGVLAFLVAPSNPVSATNASWSVKYECGPDHMLHFGATVTNQYTEALTYHIDASSSWFGQTQTVQPGQTQSYPIAPTVFPSVDSNITFTITGKFASGAGVHWSPTGSVRVTYTAGKCGATPNPTTTTNPDTPTSAARTTVPEPDVSTIKVPEDSTTTTSTTTPAVVESVPASPPAGPAPSGPPAPPRSTVRVALPATE